ncbi:MAG: glycerol-3-phosphate 1-O-acyltransferase PlsY [Clostridia bacterium]|nr:glycerol-3-phosphate 1-O-acyltransferase PlsY [Clostridia bacterium]
MEWMKIMNDGLIPYLLDYRLNGWILVGCILLCMIPSYLLGSLNFALILSRRFFGEDVRQKGSGNAGMTNMLRNYGKGAAALTLLGDALKAVVSSLIGYVVFGVTGAYIAGLFCILGHMFPIYYRFKGGKGVVTTAVMILMLNPVIFLILLAVFLLIVLGTRFISLGSVMCVMIWPLILQRMEGAGAPVLMAMAIAALVVFMHHENIKRLLRGEENKVSSGKKKKPAEKEDETDE